MKIDTNGKWKLYWGNMPLPKNSKAIGTVDRKESVRGALLLLESGLYVCGNVGCIGGLDQVEVKRLLEVGE